MPSGDCFRCQQPGHWLKDCPLTNPTKSLDSSLPSSPPLIHCPCDAGACNLVTSRSNRKFYQCPAVPSCRFFKWCNQVSIRSSSLSNHLVCPCGSGPCRRVSVIAGPNAGRSYFICAIKKSFGDCRFFQWEDAQIPAQPEQRHTDSPCSTVIRFPNFDTTDDENSTVEADSISTTSHGLVIPQTSIPSNDSTLSIPRGGISECSSSIKPPFDKIQAYKDETGNQMLPSLDPKNVEGRQVETLCVDQPRSDASENTSNPVLSGSFVKNSINASEHESTSGETEASFSGSSSFLNLIEQYNSKKLHFESVSLKHDKALTAFTSSLKQLESLRDKENSLRKHLFEVEKEISACEAETSEYATSLQQVSGEMLESQKKMAGIAEKVAKELGVYKASFDLQ